jgi:hypothetical protein
VIGGIGSPPDAVRAWAFYHPRIPRPRRLRRERLPAALDGLDCLLAIWIAQAMLDEPAPSDGRGTRLARREGRTSSTGTGTGPQSQYLFRTAGHCFAHPSRLR